MQLELDEAKKETTQIKEEVIHLQAVERNQRQVQQDEQIKGIEETLRTLKDPGK